MELRVGEIGSHVYAAASRVLNPSNSILADNIDEQKREAPKKNEGKNYSLTSPFLPVLSSDDLVRNRHKPCPFLQQKRKKHVLVGLCFSMLNSSLSKRNQ
jgi:hypothetical protein